MNAMQVRYRQFRVQVAQVRRLSPAFVRITFSGDELTAFGAGGFDQRIKVILPGPAGTLADLPGGDDWYQRWRDLPTARRPVLRTYTVRATRPAQAEVDVDFVLHGVAGGHPGPAARWAALARPGDEAVLVGPDRPGSGRAWGCAWSPPADAWRLLLAGDETAVPAVCAVLEGLPDGTDVTALLEVPTTAARLRVARPAGADVRWFARDGGGHAHSGGHAHGEQLSRAVRETVARWASPPPTAAARDDIDDIAVDATVLWDVPEADAPGDGLYIWLAGEAAVIRSLRRHLIGDLGLPRGAVACMGYWRHGRAEHE